MNNIKISIIIPVYNAEKFLRETIQSVLSQTYHNIELILVNDGSSDNSQQIIDEFEKIDTRIISITTENMGAPHARNTGFDASSGEYVIFFDADDIMLPNEVTLLCSNICEGVELVIGSRDKITENGKTFRSDRLKAGTYDPTTKDIEYLASISPFPNNKLYSSKVLKSKQVRFHDVKIAQDANLYLKYLSVCRNVVVISECVCLYRVVGNSISRTYSNKVIDIIRCVKNIEGFALENKANDYYITAMYAAFIKYCYGQIMKIGFMKDKKTRLEVLDTIGSYVLSLSISKKIENKHALRLIAEIKKMLDSKKWYTSSTYCFYRKISMVLRQFAIDCFALVRHA